MDYIRYITEGIESICKHHKRRTAGSETVRSAQAEMAASMKDCVDEIRTQQFEIHPQAFMGSVPLEAFLCLISCAFVLVGVYRSQSWAYMVSLVFMMSAVVAVVAEYALYRQLTDRFYPRKTGQNLYMVRKASERGAKAVFFSIEMTTDELAMRMIASVTEEYEDENYPGVGNPRRSISSRIKRILSIVSGIKL